jgi:hypothetical protein
MLTQISTMTTWLSSAGPLGWGVMMIALALATAGLVVVTHRRIALDAPRRAGRSIA